MSRNLEVTVNLPTAVLRISKEGCRYTPGDDRDTEWTMPLEASERALGYAHQAVKVLLGVEGRPIPAPGASLGDDVVGGRGRDDLAASRCSDPAPLPSPPLCPFCQQQTCGCWVEHECR